MKHDHAGLDPTHHRIDEVPGDEKQGSTLVATITSAIQVQSKSSQVKPKPKR